MFEVGRLVARLALEGAETFNRQLAGVRAEWAKLADTQKMTAQDAARNVGGVMVGAGAALVASTALVIKAAIDWQSAWAGVTKTVEGTPQELADVEAGLRALTGVMPAAHSEIAAVAEAAGQLGIETGNVVAFTKTMIDLGETTNLSSEEAATSLARFMNVMGTSQKDVSRLGSALVGLGNNYATTESEILAMATRLSGAGRQIGLSEGATLGLAAALSSVGIEAEAGGSAVSKVMIDIASSVDKGGARLDLFAKTAGVSADTFAAKWKKNPGDALALFVKGLANAEAQGTSTFAVLEELGITEVRMRDALLRSAAASDMFAGAMSRGNVEFELNNALLEEAAKRYETAESKIAIAGNAINDAAIDIGAVFLPAIAAAAEAVAGFAGWFSDLDPIVQGTIGVVGMLTGATLLMGGTMLLAVPKIIEFRAALAVMQTSMPRTVGAMRGVTSFLGGPWGSAFMAGALLVSLMIGKNAEYQQEVESLTGTLDENTGALTENTRAAVAKMLQDKGVFDSAKQLGLSLSTITDAALGNRDAIAEVEKAQKTYAQGLGETASLAEGFWANIGGSAPSRITDGIDAMNNKVEDAGRKFTEQGEAASTGAGKTLEAADAYAEAADEASALRDAITELIAKVMEANGLGQDAISTNASYQAAIEKVRETVEQAKAGAEGYSTSIDANTAAGSANLEMFAEMAEKAQKAAEAQLLADGDTQRYIGTLGAQRQALYDLILELTGSAEAADQLSDSIFRMPSEKEIEFIANTAKAQQDIDNFVWSNDGRTITLNGRLQENWMLPAVLREAQGGRVEYFANGGRREHHVAQIARAGTTRVWAEPETDGETYIPHAMSKRDRSTVILAETADDFGYELVPKGSRSGPAFDGSASTTTQRGAVSLTIVNPTVRDVLDDAQEAADLIGASQNV